MDEFDIHLESAGSIKTYSGNTIAAFRNFSFHPVQFEGDWRVALAEIIFPTSIKNITNTDFFILAWKHSGHKCRSRCSYQSRGLVILSTIFADLGVTEIVEAPLQNLNSNMWALLLLYGSLCVWHKCFLDSLH